MIQEEKVLKKDSREKTLPQADNLYHQTMHPPWQTWRWSYDAGHVYSSNHSYVFENHSKINEGSAEPHLKFHD